MVWNVLSWWHSEVLGLWMSELQMLTCCYLKARYEERAEDRGGTATLVGSRRIQKSLMLG